MSGQEVRTSEKKICARICMIVAVLPLLVAAGPEETLPPTLQELEVAGRVLHFQAAQPSGSITMAVVFSAADPRSRTEAAALAVLFGSGLSAGELVLRPVLVEQSNLANGTSYGAVFATIGVDAGLLGVALRQLHVPCLTRHVDQVAHGTCIVAISSAPRVSIVLSTANAAAADVHFATAFRMMVDE